MCRGEASVRMRRFPTRNMAVSNKLKLQVLFQSNMAANHVTWDPLHQRCRRSVFILNFDEKFDEKYFRWPATRQTLIRGFLAHFISSFDYKHMAC